MKSSNDKVIITKKGGKWVYFSVNDEADSGTIVDFVANRSSKTIPEIGELLSQWSGLGAIPHPTYQIKDQAYDQQRVKAIFNRCKPVETSDYLESRGLGYDLLHSDRFKGRVFVDRHNNLVFPHYSKGKTCGLELKNADRGLLVKGSQKTFWRSNTKALDNTIVVTESVIDALSYHKIVNPTNCFYLATGGGVSARQCDLLVRLLESSETISDVIVATDNDKGGDRIGRRIFEAVDRSLYNGKIVRRRPRKKGSDWSDMVMGK